MKNHLAASHNREGEAARLLLSSQALTNTLAQECKIRDVGAEASVVSLDLWIQGDHTGTQGQTQT